MRWTLEDGLRLIRAVQSRAKQFGFHIALAGGVLNNGTSEKDIDLIFLPFNNVKVAQENQDGLVEWLTELWGYPEPIGEGYEDDENLVPFGPRYDIVDNPDVPGGKMVVPHYEVGTHAATKGCYRKKLKFTRGDDRIDVFIV
jgi:hypothetical protein